MKKRILAIIVCLAMVFTTYGYIGIDYGIVGTANAETKIPACNCNNDNADIISHSDGCAEKIFYMNICKNHSAEKIYENWNDYPSDAQEYILAYLSWTNWGKLSELKRLIEKGEGSEHPSSNVVKNGVATVETKSGEVITVEGNIPEGSTVQVASINEEQFHEDLVMFTEGDAPIFALDLSFKEADGTAWQPNEGNKIEVSVSADYEDGTKIGVMHVHEGTASSLGLYGDWTVQNGKLTFETDAFSEFYGYIVEQPEFIKEPGKVFANVAPLIKEKAEEIVETFSLFSLFSLGRSSEEESAEVEAIDESNSESDVVLNKTVAATGTPGNESFKLTLDAYATGSEGTVSEVPTPSDIVLVLDESGSMNDCIECNHEFAKSKPRETIKNKNDKPVTDENGNTFIGHKVFNDEIWTYKTYLVIYPADQTHRIVKYCETHKGWYSTGHNAKGKHTGAKWVPFTEANQTPTNRKNVSGETTTDDAWVCDVQFYCVCDHTTQRMDALKNALNSFIGAVYEDSVADDIDNRVAIISYGKSDTEVLHYTSSDQTNWAATAFKPIKAEADKNALLGIVNDQIMVRSSTPTHIGIRDAKAIFDANPISDADKRNRVMILFTDGAPGSGYAFYDGKYPGTTKDWTNPGIADANTIKNTHGATVYTVGLFPGADASTPANLPAYTSGKEGSGQHNEAFFNNANRFLHLVSSNYPKATSMSSTGAVNSSLNGDSYYLSTENEAGLYEIFDALSKVIEPGSTTVTLDETTVLKDIVTPYFEIPEGTNGKAKVTAYTEDFDGFDSEGNRKWKNKANVSIPGDTSSPLDVKVDGRTITVDGFDYAENYVGTNKDENNNDVYRGKRLVVEIEIVPTEDFLGGDDVDTNDKQSGLYVDDKIVDKFPVPNVDVNVKEIDPTIISKDIYLSQAAKLPEILNIGYFEANGHQYTVNDINNDYVDIKYTLTDPDTGKTILCTIPAGNSDPDGFIWEVASGLSKEPVLEKDTTYHVLCEVVSKNAEDKTAEGKHSEKEDSATINVYKPVVTFEDSILDLGETANYSTDNYVEVKWMHGETEADASKLGTAPILVYTYDTAEDAFIADTPVKVLAVTAKADGAVPVDKDILNGTTFYREVCDFNRCTHTSKTLVNKADSAEPNFIVHPNNFDLVLSKEGILTIDHHDKITGVLGQIVSNQEKQSTIYKITGPNGFETRVAICGNDSITLKGLAAGEYTIRELEDWSWRYDVESVQYNNETPLSSKQLTFISENPVENVKFTNRRNNVLWLNGGAYCKNMFGIFGNN